MTFSVALPDRTVRNQQSMADLEGLAKQGLLTRKSLVWREGWPAWVPAGEVIELASIFRTPPPPAIAPPVPAAASPVVRAGTTAPSSSHAYPRNYLLLGCLAAVAIGMVLLVGGVLAWRFWRPASPPAVDLPQNTVLTDDPVRPADPSEARVVLYNQRLLLEALRFRNLASGKLQDALGAYREPACCAFLRSSDLGRAAPQVWAYFFSTSLLLIGHAQNSAPVIAFYNPFLDAALMTRWCWEGDQATIEDATLWIGSCFPDGQAGAPEYPRWMSNARTTPFHEALLSGMREFTGRFERMFPIRPVDAMKFPQSVRRSEAQTFVEQQAAAQLWTLMKLREHPGLTNLRKALAEGRADMLDTLIPPGAPFTSATLLKLPRDLRQRLVPAFALSSAQYTLVVLSVPEMPRFYVLAQFGTAGAPLQHLSVQELN